MNDIKKKKEEIIVEPKEVEFETSMDRKGYATIKFNQLMQIPEFGKLGRKLGISNETIALSNINVARDILNLDFILKSDTDPKEIKYSLELKEWSTKRIGIQIYFEDPLQIS